MRVGLAYDGFADCSGIVDKTSSFSFKLLQDIDLCVCVCVGERVPSLCIDKWVYKGLPLSWLSISTDEPQSTKLLVVNMFSQCQLHHPSSAVSATFALCKFASVPVVHQRGEKVRPMKKIHWPFRNPNTYSGIQGRMAVAC